jgi:DnaJ-class molecular chaperone
MTIIIIEDDHEYEECDTCNGKGKIYEEGQPTGVHARWVGCPDCDGMGKFEA